MDEIGSPISIGLFHPGDLVTCDSEPDWGVGQVQSAVGTRVTVNFEDRGKVVVETRIINLSLYVAK